MKLKFMSKLNKTFNQLERIVKGFANHRRIEILELLSKEPELSVADISEKLNVNFKTISEHIRKMAVAGLVLKRYESSSVRHKLTGRALATLKFLKALK